MFFQKKIFLLIILLGLFFACSTEKKEELQEETVIPEIDTKVDIENLVNDAVELIEQKGEEAFPEFRKSDSKWYHDDTYVFVWGINGIRYVYPPDRDMENMNVKGLDDLRNKPIGEEFIKIAKKGSGWINYLWKKPHEVEPKEKSTFIKKAIAPDSTEYLVGCGKYDLKTEKEANIKGSKKQKKKM